MKVFGIGYHKTGTSTLGKALNILGFNNHKSYNFDLIKEWDNNNIEAILKVARNNNNFEDWPWPLVYQELFNEFNDAKFILTTRKDSETWFKSLSKNSKGPNRTREMIYGEGDPNKAKNHYMGQYEEHNETVKAFFNENAPDKLLTVCWDDGDSWDKLCNFLNKKKPNKSFPHVNKT